jgi:transcriptional regulator with XRE-family HTH domain
VLPEEIQKLRKSLSCTAKELAAALGVDPKEVAAWESGELFPTKKHVEHLHALREKGPASIPRAPRGKPVPKRGVERLADPELWRLLRKLLEHPVLFEEARKLAEKYPDPTEPPPKSG